MFNTTDEQRAARTVTTELARLGVKMPPRIAKAIKAQEEHKAGIAALIAKGNAVADLAAARARGESVDPTEATDALLGAALAMRPEQREILERATAGDLLEAVKADADATIEAMRPLFDDAAATINQARATLGDIDLTDLQAVTAVGGDAAEWWQKAQTAERTIEQIKRLTGTLRTARAYPGTRDAREGMLAVVDVDLDGYKRIHKGTTAWAAAGVGTLSLATPAEYTTRLGALDQAWGRDPKNPATRLGPGVGQYPTDREPVDVIGGAL